MSDRLYSNEFVCLFTGFFFKFVILHFLRSVTQYPRYCWCCCCFSLSISWHFGCLSIFMLWPWATSILHICHMKWNEMRLRVESKKLQSYAFCLFCSCFRSQEILFIFIEAKAKDFLRNSLTFCILLHSFTYTFKVALYLPPMTRSSFTSLCIVGRILHVFNSVCEFCLQCISLSLSLSIYRCVLLIRTCHVWKKAFAHIRSIVVAQSFLLYFTNGDQTRYDDVHC